MTSPQSNESVLEHVFSLRKQALYGFLILAIYLLLTPSVFGPITNTVAVGGDQHYLINPVMHYAQEFDKFRDPLTRIWFSEYDIHHNPHFNTRYPFFFFWLGDAGGYMGFSHRAFLIAHFHQVIAGLGAFIFARALGARPVSAFAAGLFFMFCYNNTMLSVFFWRQAASAWIPWVLAGIWLVTTGKNWKLGTLIGAPAVALLVFAKCAQPLLYLVVSGIIVGLAGTYYGYAKSDNLKSFFSKIVMPSTGFFLLAIALSLPVFLPVFLGQSEYVRWTSTGPVQGSYKVPFHATLEMTYPAKGVFNLLVPMRGMPTIGSTFIGPILGLLVFATLTVRKYRLLAFMMLGLFIYFVLNGFGEKALVPHLTYKLPMINNVRELPSHYLLVNVAAIALFAIGWDRFFKIKKTNYTFLTVLLVSILITLFAIINFHDLFDERSVFSQIVLVTSPLLLLVVIRQTSPIRKEVLLAILAILVILPSSQLRNYRVFDATKAPLYNDEVSQDIRAGWEWVSGKKENAVVAAKIIKYKDGKATISSRRAASLAMYNNLRPFNTGMSPRPIAEFKHFNSLGRDVNKLIDRGLEFYATNDAKDYSSNRLRLAKKFGTVSVYEVLAPVQRLKPACTIRPRGRACDVSLDIQSMKETNTSFDYDIQLPSQQTLAFFGFKNDNWRVDINGSTPELDWTTDHVFFTLPAGSHKISFQYKVQHLGAYWNVFKIGFLIYLVLMVWSIFLYWRKRLPARATT